MLSCPRCKYSFAAMALMLGHLVQKHNDLRAMSVELVLLVREDDKDSITAEDKTRLERVGCKIRIAEELTFDGVDNGKIRAHRRYSLNKLYLWSWTEYEKIIFVDADAVYKGAWRSSGTCRGTSRPLRTCCWT